MSEPTMQDICLAAGVTKPANLMHELRRMRGHRLQLKTLRQAMSEILAPKDGEAVKRRAAYLMVEQT